MRPPRSHPGYAAVLFLLGGGLVAACGELTEAPLGAEREPAEIRFHPERLVLQPGQEALVELRIYDGHGRVFDPLPPWIRPTDQVEGEGAVATSWVGGPPWALDAVGLAPGVTRIRARVQEARGEVLLGVNPGSAPVWLTHVHITQATQRMDGTVPLVAGRAGILRVFGRSTTPNAFTPAVRIQLLHDGAPSGEREAHFAGMGIPGEEDPETFEGSWSLALDGSEIQPGLAARVVMTPGPGEHVGEGSVLEVPEVGEPGLFDVRSLPPVPITFVPIHAQELEALPTASLDRVDSILDTFVRTFPLPGVQREIGPPLETDHSARSPGGWLAILQQLAEWREEHAPNRYVVGLMGEHESRLQGIAALGHPLTLVTEPDSRASWFLAHELGHAMGLLHAPCNVRATLDPDYPEPGAWLDVPGVDVEARTIIPRTRQDLMGYCPNNWISAYHYERALDFREHVEPERLATGALPVGATVILHEREGRVGVALVEDDRFELTFHERDGTPVEIKIVPRGGVRR